MALKRPKIEKTDPRLKGHETTYEASRGGYYPAKPKPVPGKPKKR